jgi:uncharacterized iron-regulated membrane protein
LVSRAQLPLDAVYRFAREEAPQECRLATLALPRKPGAVIVADCISPGNPPFAAMRRMFFHPQSGQLLSNLHSTSQPWGIRLSMAMAPIHFGQWGGTASKIMWSILGLVPGMLAVSGLLMWWNRVLSRNFGRAGSFAAALGFSDKAEKVAARASRFGG